MFCNEVCNRPCYRQEDKCEKAGGKWGGGGGRGEQRRKKTYKSRKHTSASRSNCHLRFPKVLRRTWSRFLATFRLVNSMTNISSVEKSIVWYMGIHISKVDGALKLTPFYRGSLEILSLGGQKFRFSGGSIWDELGPPLVFSILTHSSLRACLLMMTTAPKDEACRHHHHHQQQQHHVDRRGPGEGHQLSHACMTEVYTTHKETDTTASCYSHKHRTLQTKRTFMWGAPVRPDLPLSVGRSPH